MNFDCVVADRCVGADEFADAAVDRKRFEAALDAAIAMLRRSRA